VDFARDAVVFRERDDFLDRVVALRPFLELSVESPFDDLATGG
jgi:hypothetical protein